MELCGGSPLWNETLLWENTWPEFTSCFQDTVLVYVPCGWLWVTLLPYLIYLLKCAPGLPLPTSTLSVAKPSLCLVLVGFEAVKVFAGLDSDVHSPPYTVMFYVGRSLEAVTYLLAAMLSLLCTSHGVTTSSILFVFWLQLSVAGIIPLYSNFIQEVYTTQPFLFYAFLLQYPLVILQLILHCFAEKTHNFNEYDYETPQCPEVKASFISRILFWWMTKLIVLGFRKPLDGGDLWDLHPRDQCHRVLPQFEAVWREEQQKSSSSSVHKSGSLGSFPTSSSGSDERWPLLSSGRLRNHQGVTDGAQQKWPSLSRVLFRTFYPVLLKSYCCKAVSDVLQFVSPLLLSALIYHIELGAADYPWKGYVLSLGLFVVAFVQSCFYHQHFHYAMTLGMRIRTTLMATLYKKALFLNSEAQKTSTVGEIVNLMAVDCQRIQDMISYTWMVWSIPFQACLAVYLLWSKMGAPVLAGLFVLFLLLPINAYLAYKQQQLQRLNLIQKDSRIKLLNEVLNGIKVLKLYAWEPSFRDKILAIREKELKILMKIAYLNGISTFVWTCAPYLVTLATFSAYVLTSNVHLDAGTAFVTLSLFNILQFPINFIPEMISNTAQARVSIDRIDKFLKSGELDPTIVGKYPNGEYALTINKATFRWDKEGRNILTNITLSVVEGKLVAVAGQVGSGKSSLLSACLGDMEIVHGKANLRGRIAYVPQQPWIQNATVRDNILFGTQMNRKRYDKVIEACALKDDLDMLPGGDMTEIGEKGINLSGGQKQRVSLARAVYSDADIYLLDDTLSAVDSHVGKHIFRKVISDKGLLKYKTRIFVTHAVHWLPLVDTVVVLSEGRVTESGSYVKLMMHDGPFAQFLKYHFSTEDNDTETDEDPEVRELKEKMWQHVESVTSTSDCATSGDELNLAIRRRRRSKLTASTGSSTSDERRQSDVDAGRLIDEEKAETGKVKSSVFISYIRAVGVSATCVIFLLFACYQAASVAANIWLARWTGDEPSPNSTTDPTLPVDRYYLTIYGVLGCAQGFFVLIYAFLASTRMVRAARTLHHDMLTRTIRSPMSFFDTTPIGRIVNRFARDVETIDNKMPRIMFMYVTTIFSVFSTLLVISINTPLFLAVVIPLVTFYFMVQRFFVPSSRQLKRLQATSRSPIFSHFSESISGASSIRAYGATDRFIEESIRRMDKNQIFYFAAVTANRWLGIWIEFVSSCVVFAASVFSLLTPGISGGAVGLSITYALQITQSLKWLVRTLSDLETNIVSVERVKEYSDLDTEADWVNSDYRPGHDWPQTGSVEFKLYTTRYRPGLDLVLKGVTCRIKGGEKVGIVGRTGAGKSSLSVALFRLVEAVGGSIEIDGHAIERLGLHDLRSRITILPQDPVLFSGSLRMNLDPFERYSEDAVWLALQQAHLKQFVASLSEGLDYQCGEGGVNLSVGQRQLVCLARALLRKSKLLVLDEATAAVDLETDTLIQETIRAEFTNCTILSIAHRLHTIMDYDRILVMGAGAVLEFDHPHVLLMNKSSHFYSLARDAGLV
ncbi:multidrug resistance-associated protein 1-like [Haliotis rufescens]|uniref:multidrug resistance-associated protein 1-like n=1 Tax=Haliotis rufescens TaxID=6454 RepID=UPI00201E8686|nr:multidrug resistance-associated protein 1-like [Haliotis rufescens]